MYLSRIGFALTCCIVSRLLIAGGIQDARSSQPDVFLITIDTLRADHVHCFGYPHIRTLALDSVARNGIQFTQAFTVSPITNSSHVSILTGLLPSIHGVTDFGSPLSNLHITWAELMTQHGYHTAAFIGSVILDSQLTPGLERGFDFYDHFPDSTGADSHWGRVERRAGEVITHAESWLNAHPSGSRFVWIHLYDPHDPYEPPAPYSRLYRHDLYDGEIAYADAALGNFIGYLKQHLWYHKAILLVLGDHGEGLGEHSEETHGIFLYDSTMHVPLIMKLPDERYAARIVEQQVRSTDILPTVLDLLKISTAVHLDGQSLMPVITGAEIGERTAYGETDYPLQFGWAPLRCVRQAGFKFIEAPRPEFYNLKLDPSELQNQYEPWNNKVQQLRALLASLRSRTSQSSTAQGTISEEKLNELIALGYFGARDAASRTTVPQPSLLPDPKDKIEVQNLLHVAMLASAKGRIAEAESNLVRVLDMQPNLTVGLEELAKVEMSSKKYADAARHLDRARDERPNDATLAFLEGEALQKMGHLKDARKALNQSLLLDARQFSPRLLLAEVCLAMSDPEAALSQFEAALAIRPDNIAARIGVAKAELAQGSFQDAADNLQELANSHPSNVESLNLLAQAYKQLGKQKESAEAERRANALRAEKGRPVPLLDGKR